MKAQIKKVITYQMYTIPVVWVIYQSGKQFFYSWNDYPATVKEFMHSAKMIEVKDTVLKRTEVHYVPA